MLDHVLIQGTRHSFHDQAAALLGVLEDQRESVETHSILYDELARRPNGRAVVAFINTTKGRIGGSYEYIAAGNVSTIGHVIGRIDLTITLPLYGIPGTRLEDIRYIHTQTHAYDQCVRTIRNGYMHARWVSEVDTAGSAFIVQALNDPQHAAIAPDPAGEAAGLERLVESMQDSDHNVTSFYLLGKGDNSIVPKDAAITVAALEEVSDKQASDRLRAVVDDGTITLLHESDIAAPRLIIEMNSGGDHMGAIANAQKVLHGLYVVKYLGGYTPVITRSSI